MYDTNGGEGIRGENCINQVPEGYFKVNHRYFPFKSHNANLIIAIIGH